MPSSWSIKLAGTCRPVSSCPQISPSLRCRQNAPSSIRSKTSGSLCARALEKDARREQISELSASLTVQRVCRLIPVFIEVSRALASRQRMFGEMQLAEGVHPGSNLLQVDPRNPAKLLAMERITDPYRRSANEAR